MRRIFSACAAWFALGTTAGAQDLSILAPLDNAAPIPYFIAEGLPGSEFRDSDHELAEWALKAWARSAAGAFELVPSEESSALLRIYWVPAAAGQYGEMRPLRVDGRRGAAVFIRPDINALGPDIVRSVEADPLLREVIVYLTCVHEIGHAFGLEHTSVFEDVMYFFGYGGDIPRFFGRFRDRLQARADIAAQSGISAGDLAQLRRLYAENEE